VQDRVVLEIANIVLVSGEKLVDLGSLKSTRDRDLLVIGMNIQRQGYGRIIEVGGQANWEYKVRLTERGFAHASGVRSALESRSLAGRLRTINWNAINAIAALIAAIAAIAAAYFSYLSLVSK
jgi:hypothetical protein